MYEAFAAAERILAEHAAGWSHIVPCNWCEILELPVKHDQLR